MLDFNREEKKPVFAGHFVSAVPDRPILHVVVLMMSVQRCVEVAQHWLGVMGPREWTVIAAVMLVIGLLCLRGLGVNRTY